MVVLLPCFSEAVISWRIHSDYFVIFIGRSQGLDEYLVRPIDQAEDVVGGGDLEAGDEENSEQEEADDDGEIRREAPGGVSSSRPLSSSPSKRSRDEDNALGGGSVEDSRLPKRR